MKLKTLKDVGVINNSDTRGLKHDLKQEAIKWVKASDKKHCDRIDAKKFMEFHNITEEDLK